MKISKTMMQPSNDKGIMPPIIPNGTTNPPIIFNIMCPTVILATKRTVKLNGLDKNEIVSIGMIKGAKAKGIPFGKKVLSQPSFFFFIPMQMLNANAIRDKPPTAARCDVYVKAYGNSPSKLPKATNKNIVNIKLKYFRPSVPTFSLIKFEINAYIPSGIHCALVGTILRRLKHKLNSVVTQITDSTINNDELVNETL